MHSFVYINIYIYIWHMVNETKFESSLKLLFLIGNSQFSKERVEACDTEFIGLKVLCKYSKQARKTRKYPSTSSISIGVFWQKKVIYTTQFMVPDGLNLVTMFPIICDFLSFSASILSTFWC